MHDDFEVVKSIIRGNALKMLKEGNGVFKHPFIDPGAGYENNLWDWDSYWSACALFGYCEYFKKYRDFDYQHTKERVVCHAKGNILNFFDLQQKDGFIAMVTTADGLFSSLLKDEHAAGKKVNQHKPFLCKGVYNASVYSEEFYEQNQYDEKSGLFFWRNDQMIGIDNNPTVFGMPEDSVADIYLNCFLYTEFVAMANICKARGEDDSEYIEKAVRLKESIRRELYDRRVYRRKDAQNGNFSSRRGRVLAQRAAESAPLGVFSARHVRYRRRSAGENDDRAALSRWEFLLQLRHPHARARRKNV